MASRRELFLAAGVIREHPKLDDWTEKAYADLEERIWRENLESSPHGRPWHTSFHSSSFPSGEKPCPRKALYTLMDIPDHEPISPFLRGVADIGQAVEYQILYRWGKAGMTIGGSVPIQDGNKSVQTGFADNDTWLTGSVDGVLDLRPEYKHVIPVDVKSKKHSVVQEMKDGERSYEEKHYLQVQSYIYLCNKFHEEMGWADMGLLPAKSGYIYYASREDPRTTAEFFVEADWNLINNGIALLKEWREYFLNEHIPERPKEWLWTLEPCRYCRFKKHSCKPDWKSKNTSMKDSSAIEFAKSLRPDYDYELIREEVNKRWL